MNCKGCKHWSPDNEPIGKDYGFCRKVGEAYDGEPMQKGLLAYTMTYEELSTDLVTFKDFGCVLFDVK